MRPDLQRRTRAGEARGFGKRESYFCWAREPKELSGAHPPDPAKASQGGRGAPELFLMPRARDGKATRNFPELGAIGQGMKPDLCEPPAALVLCAPFGRRAALTLVLHAGGPLRALWSWPDGSATVARVALA